MKLARPRGIPGGRAPASVSTGIANLKITTRSRWSDMLITGLTLGLLVPRTVVYEGVVVNRP